MIQKKAHTMCEQKVRKKADCTRRMHGVPEPASDTEPIYCAANWKYEEITKFHEIYDKDYIENVIGCVPGECEKCLEADRAEGRAYRSWCCIIM